ncbi:MurR/RpiR family transcriptional regulator [Agrilactobacillus fermenti]|uniref:MurR/RpiR family transcriptional regulator n=1 Tax=Agrilactobacillus fermenti TaxID=2586909 RepID=UPI003A5BEA73
MRVESRIRQLFSTFGPTSQIIANYVIENPEAFATKSINELANDLQVSTASISRFAKAIGFPNFSKMKIALSKDSTETNQFHPIVTGDTALDGARKTISANISALNNTLDFMSDPLIDQATQLLRSADHIGLFGLGSSNVIAQAAYHSFLLLPVNLIYQNDYHMQLMNASLLTKKDIAIAISHTGNNADILALTDIFQQNQVPILAITSFPTSPLARLADISFFSTSEDTKYRPEALISMTAQLGIIDVLYTELNRKFGGKSTQRLRKVRSAIQKKHRG